MALQPQIRQLIADSVVIDGEAVTTIVALLDDNTIVYTGAAPGAEWHQLSPIPALDELD